MTGANASMIPADYVTPKFPSLYWPVKTMPHEPKFLYHSQDIWRFTLFWTMIIFEAFHLAASAYAMVIQWRNWKLMWLMPLVYLFVAGVEAVLAGSVVGLMYVSN